MKRTQIYIDPEQHEFLEAMAFYLSRTQKRKVSMSEVIRQAIEMMRKNNPSIQNETDLILQSANIMDGIKKAKEDKDFYNHDEVFGDK